MHRLMAFSEDQGWAHQTPVPIALEVENPKTDVVLQLEVYLDLINMSKQKYTKGSY